MKNCIPVAILAWVFWSCTPKLSTDYQEMIYQTDSILHALVQAREITKLPDTVLLIQYYDQLLQTDKYAGLAFDYQKIARYKNELRQTIYGSHQISSMVSQEIAALKALKQSLRHHEYDSLSLSVSLSESKLKVRNLIMLMDSISITGQRWQVQGDSLMSGLIRH